MPSSRLFAAATLLAFLPVHSITAQDLASLKNDPSAAANFDYCAWQFVTAPDTAQVAYFRELLDAEDVPEEEMVVAVYVTGGVRVAQNAENQKSCDKTFEKGEKRYKKNFSKKLKDHKKRARYKISSDSIISAVQDSLTDYWVEDQARRRSYLDMRTEDSTGVEYWARRVSVAETTRIDGEATAYMKSLLDRFDWIDIDRFGKEVSNKAWLLVQHADDHPSFQAKALERMEKYLDKDGVSKSNYAFLYDRVAVNHDRLQLYGTQPTWECTDTGLVLAPMEDPENVNKRRKEMGMDKVEEQLANMTKSVCG